MSKKNYDQKTQKKLHNLYQEAISKYSSENENLRHELSDLKETLDLNQNLLYNFMMNSQKDEDMNNLITKSKSLWEKNESLMELEKDLEIKEYKLQQIKEALPIKINEKLQNIVNNNKILINEIFLKEKNIEKLKKELEKARKDALFKDARTEIYVTGPTPYNIIKNEEFRNAKLILANVIRKKSNEKKKAGMAKKELKTLKEKTNKLKKIINTNNNNDFYSKIEGYNIEADNYKFEESEEEEEEEEDSSDDEPDEGKVTKKKQKELKRLNDEYTKLKTKYEAFQNKIKELKEEYRKFNEEINDIKIKNKK